MKKVPEKKEEEKVVEMKPTKKWMECGPDLILIDPDEVKREPGSKIEMSEEEKRNANKEQNRGKIIWVGSDVKFWEVGDYISFYKGATTTIREGGKDYLTIHKGHVQVRFKETLIVAE